MAALNREQHRRGPDDAAVNVVDSVVFGHTRLATLGSTETGRQPFASRDGSILVVFDGVISNHRELRWLYDLSTASGCDGAILPDLWQRLGTSMFALLRGMYAIAVYDRRSRTVTLARDPLGVKPLHWTRTERGAVAFASEPRPLVSTLPARRLNLAVLYHYLGTGEALDGQSPFEGIEPVPVNGWMQWSLDGGTIHGPASGVVHPGVFADTIGAGPYDLRAEFLDAVSGQLTSDAPVAVPLTLDFGSASVAWACAELGRYLPCVTVDLGCETPERDSAAKLAARYGHQHEIIPGEPDESVMALYFSSMQEPTVRGLETFLVSRAVGGCGARVAVAGIGANELLTGHPRSRLLRRLPLLRRVVPGAPPRAEEAPGWLGGCGGPRPQAARFRPAYHSALERFDSSSMVWSVEHRAPYSDVRLVHALLANGIAQEPGRLRFADRLGDPRLIEIARRSPAGRALPIEQWMRHGPLAPWVRAAASPDAPVRRLLRAAIGDDTLAGWNPGQLDRSQVWLIASLNGWLSTLHPDFVDESPTLPSRTAVGFVAGTGG